METPFSVQLLQDLGVAEIGATKGFVAVVYHVTIVAIGHGGVVEEILAYGNRLRSTHCREFPYRLIMLSYNIVKKKCFFINGLHTIFLKSLDPFI